MVKIVIEPVFMRIIKETYLNENKCVMATNMYPSYYQKEFLPESISSEEDYNIEIDISEFPDIETILTEDAEEEKDVDEDVEEERRKRENKGENKEGENKGKGEKKEEENKEEKGEKKGKEIKYVKDELMEIPKFPRSLKRANRYKLVTRRIDNGRIRHKSVKNMEVFTSDLKSVKMVGDGPIRSGAIIYTHFQGKTYFALGQDSIHGDLTDFSGGKKQRESIIEGGLRELEEESLGVFGKLLVGDVKDCMGFHTNNMLIMFIHLDVNMQRVVEEFDKRLGEKSEKENLEVNQIVWLEKSDFLKSIEGKGRRLYSRVRRLLSKVTEIISEI